MDLEVAEKMTSCRLRRRNFESTKNGSNALFEQCSSTLLLPCQHKGLNVGCCFTWPTQSASHLK